MRAIQSVLVVEDDETIQNVLKSFLEKKGFEVTLAQNGEAALDLLRTETFDLVLTDLVMPGKGGMEVLKGAAASQPDTPVIVVTGFGTVQSAVEAMRAGAFDYLTKPFNLEELMIVLNKALSVSKLQKENVMLKMQLKKKYVFKGIIGDSPSMQAVYELIEKIADTDSTVLITGESGTGKELVARTIHYNNTRRAHGPFVALNCAAIPKDLLASELFGHEKGAFTGAIAARPGRFELAQGGTLFLDEVGELDPALQVKLLRVLQEREFQRVGGVKTIKVDVRILAATNADLDKATKEGTFREDLFYRLNVIPLHLPPLRSRPEDIALLTAHFVREFSQKRKREPLIFAPETADCLMKYRWPGNVRELENLIERLSILVNGRAVQVPDLPEKLHGLNYADRGPLIKSAQPTAGGAEGLTVPAGRFAGIELDESGIDLNGMISSMERHVIQQALGRTGGVRSKAAELLGLNRTTLLEKMKKMGIETRKRSQPAKKTLPPKTHRPR
jgi:nitrogen regulation protein NR(I)